MKDLYTQLIINKMEVLIKKKTNAKKLTKSCRKLIESWSINMYNDYDKNNELEEIKNNNISNEDFEKYFDNNKLLYF